MLNNYALYVLKPFHFVRTTLIGNKVGKACCLLWAIISFTGQCLFGGIQIVHIHGASYISFWRKRIFILLAKAYPAREFALSHFDIATTAQNYIKAYQTP